MNTMSADLAVMFADIAGSSVMYKQLGDLRAKAIVDGVMGLLGDKTRQHGGVVVKTIGDEIMARFDSAATAVEAACDMQRALRGNADLSVRVGIHFGNCLIDSGDLFGEAVNDAAAIVAVAREEQIVVSQAVVNAAGNRFKGLVRRFDRIRTKGSTHWQTIYLVDWRGDNTATEFTVLGEAMPPSREGVPSTVTLRLGSAVYPLAEQDCPFHVGRDERRADLVVVSPYASRSHLTIEFHRGKFVLVDHSTNGTYVTPRGQGEMLIKREQLPLVISGVISLGCPAAKNDDQVLSFTIAEAIAV